MPRLFYSRCKLDHTLQDSYRNDGNPNVQSKAELPPDTPRILDGVGEIDDHENESTDDGDGKKPCHDGARADVDEGGESVHVNKDASFGGCVRVRRRGRAILREKDNPNDEVWRDDEPRGPLYVADGAFVTQEPRRANIWP